MKLSFERFKCSAQHIVTICLRLEAVQNFTRVSSLDTAATLQQIKELPTRTYDVHLNVKDLQGFGRVQTAKVRICQCRNGACLTKPRSVSLGALALLAMLLPLALLLLLCKSPTAILFPVELYRLYCVDNETGFLCPCMCKCVGRMIKKQVWFLSLNYALYIGNRAMICNGII